MNLIHIVAGNSIGELSATPSTSAAIMPLKDIMSSLSPARLSPLTVLFAEAGVTLAHAPIRDYPDLFSSLTLKNIISGLEGKTVIHVHRYRDALTAIAARRMARRPDIRIVITRHISEPAKDNSLRRFIYSQVDAHIFVSEFSRRYFLSTWPSGRYPFDPGRLHVVHDSRDLLSRRLQSPRKAPSRQCIMAESAAEKDSTLSCALSPGCATPACASKS